MNHRLHLIILVLSSASFACSVFLGGPTLPASPSSASPDNLQTLQSDIEKAVAESATDGTLHLEITQEQLTAYLASKLSAQGNPVITEPQVVLEDQKMVIYGRARSGMFEANVALTAQFDIDEEGRPKITISDAELGPMLMPQALRDAITAAVDEALTGYVGPVAIGFRLESIDIASGVMTITGRLR
jgi:hypothetical protein